MIAMLNFNLLLPCCRRRVVEATLMNKLLVTVLPLLWSCLAIADEVKDAPIPTEMNWVGIVGFAVVFFGLTIGFIVAVYLKSRGKNSDKAPDA
jgi:hypothetical protein